VSGLDDKRRVVVEIREDLHQALRKTAILNELKLYVLVNGIVEDALRDQERLKMLIRSLKL
jgi:hypothetical protein